MHTERYCQTLDNLDRTKAVRAIHQALLQLAAHERGADSLDNRQAIADLRDCLKDAGHMGFTPIAA